MKLVDLKANSVEKQMFPLIGRSIVYFTFCYLIKQGLAYTEDFVYVVPCPSKVLLHENDRLKLFQHYATMGLSLIDILKRKQTHYKLQTIQKSAIDWTNECITTNNRMACQVQDIITHCESTVQHSFCLSRIMFSS